MDCSDQNSALTLDLEESSKNWTRFFPVNIKKRLIRKICSLIEVGSFSIKYWDGTEEKYGEGPTFFKIILKDSAIVGRLISDPALVFGEAYVDGRIDIIGEIDEVIRLLNLNKTLVNKYTGGRISKVFGPIRKTSVKQQKQDISRHYDLGNEFFALWLDPTMSYSCAYFRSPEDSLEQAQLQKIDHTLKKLQLQPGETLLDIGSGWGALIIRAAGEYMVKATGITLSQEQYEATRRRIEDMGLGDRIEVLLMDYRELTATGRKFDKVVSVGMFEHVGRANMPGFMQAVQNMLTPGGLMLLHTITHGVEGPPNPWIKKYIFPGGYIPSLREIFGLLPEYDFNVLDVECLRMHYAMTLDRWAEGFEKNIDWVKERYGEKFIRMWRFYLRTCAASFRYSGLSIHQLLFSKGLKNDLLLTREHLYA